jgi:hypothetical protein
MWNGLLVQYQITSLVNIRSLVITKQKKLYIKYIKSCILLFHLNMTSMVRFIY